MAADDTPQRWIAHADLDAFYASVEQRDCPAYRGRPVVVGAMPGRRGVVAAASYEARAYGIRSAMPIAEAHRRCPDAVFVRPNMDHYRQVSGEILAVFNTITPAVEPVSIDEAYLDLSGLERLFGPPAAIARELKTRVRNATGLNVSVGIGPNRLIAKLASEHRKPDGLMVVAPDQVPDFLAPMPVANLRGLGRQTQKIFARLGIETVAQLRAIPLRYLEQALGHGAARKFHNQALGIASAEVTPERQRKSISKETTFGEDVDDPAIVLDVLRQLARDVAATARREGLSGTVVSLKIRFSGFETHSRQHKRDTPTHDEREILRLARALWRHGDLPQRPIRLIGVGISDWATREAATQRDLFAPNADHARDERLLQTLDQIEQRFGKGTLRIGGAGTSDTERHR